MPVDAALLEQLACPRHGTALRETGSGLACETGHEYPVVDGIPVLLDDGPQTQWVAGSTVQAARSKQAGGSYYLDTIGISEEQRSQLEDRIRAGNDEIDPVVAYLVAATNGMAYLHLVGKLSEYPIPELRLPPGHGQSFLDVGCNWGRWCLAAARLGYSPIGIDHSLGAVLAAKRAAAQLGLKARFVVGDGRHLPFRASSFDVVFSYSVIQHFSPADATSTVKQVGRVLRDGGRSLIQMPTIFGLRCLYHQTRRGFREPEGFDVRYWSVPALRKLFGENAEPTGLSVDCFFGIGLQPADLHLMPATHRVAIRASELLRRTSRVFTPLVYAADSVYVESVKN